MEEQVNVQKIVYVCTECGTKCSIKSNINVHMKRKHKDFVKPSTLKTLKCPLCSTLFSLMTELDQHFSNVHDLPLKQENLEFNSFDEFKEWKLEIETNNQSSYVLLNSRSLNDKSKIIKYICHRSGNYTENVKNTKRERQPKVKGSNKIGSICPARITTNINYKGNIMVKYISTHIGHKLEVGRLRMTQFEREQLAGKMFQGIPHYKILNDLSKNFNPSARISYTTKHDLHNVSKSFKINSDMIFDEDDTKSVTILIEKDV
ncbi:uncharacterized protein LOC126742751 [Anthonomus grandis grandis]|uniref:uncharacterized protein LOC126742751 n=1 Tax=Anthonomus grandis grandis TaxID=2921223 RepID=UPI0021650DDA|nr:uncharacterized protein LOC126742751 [Anthonomus grandis grandis]